MIKNPHSFIKEDFKTFSKSILCLNGKLPEKSFFKKNKLPLIAVDGGLDHLIEQSIIPDLVIGDLDTAKQENISKTKSMKIVDNETFDFEKALMYLQNEHLLPTLVLGVNGGYLDQILNNIHIILKNNLIFYDPPLIGISLTNNQQIELPLHTKISFFGKGILSTEGLKWNLYNTFIESLGFISVSNRTIEESININVHEGKILALIYLDTIQDAWY